MYDECKQPSVATGDQGFLLAVTPRPERFGYNAPKTPGGLLPCTGGGQAAPDAEPVFFHSQAGVCCRPGLNGRILVMASAKTTAKAKPVAPAKSSAELWAQAFMKPEHMPEFLKRVDRAESFFNDPDQTHKLSGVDWVNQWQIIVTNMSLSHIDMLYLCEAFRPPEDMTYEPRFKTLAQLLEQCGDERQRLIKGYNREEYEQWEWIFFASRVLALWQDMIDIAPRASHPPMPDRGSLRNHAEAVEAVNEVVEWCHEQKSESGSPAFRTLVTEYKSTPEGKNANNRQVGLAVKKKYPEHPALKGKSDVQIREAVANLKKYTPRSQDNHGKPKKPK